MSPSKKAFEKSKPRSLFLEFYGNMKNKNIRNQNNVCDCLLIKPSEVIMNPHIVLNAQKIPT